MIKNLIVTLATFLIMFAALEVLTRYTVTVRNVGPSFTTYDEQLGKVHKQNARIVRRTPEFTMAFTTDADGFRRQATAVETSDRSVLFIGDSFTEGYGVNDGEEFPALIEHAFASQAPACHIRVVNAGVGDTGTGYELKMLRRVEQRVSPSAVVLQFHRNDFDDNLREKFFELDSGKLIERDHAPAGRVLRVLQSIIERSSWLSESYLIAAMKQAAEVISKKQVVSAVSDGGDAAWQEHREQLTIRLVRELVAEAQKGGRDAIFLGIGWDDPRLMGRLDREVRSLGADVVWVPSRATADRLYYRIDGHWNSKGHQYVADLLVPKLAASLGCQTPR